MKQRTSYGIIPLREIEGTWHVLLVKHHAGHWAFPKGHPEKGELPQQTAARELKEETGLDIVRLISMSPIIERYQFESQGLVVDKTVGYFLAEVGGKVLLQPRELSHSKWVSIGKANEEVTFPQAKEVCQKVQAMLDIS